MRTCGYPTVPLLRAWSQAQTDHLYTTNTTEMNTFLVNGYTDQGVAAYILPSDTKAPTAVPLFRLYNPRSTDHYLTANASDRDRVISRNGYVSQGVVGFVYAHGECGTVPLRRLFGQHSNFFTADEAEVHDYVEQFGYEDLGVTAYVNPQCGER